MKDLTLSEHGAAVEPGAARTLLPKLADSFELNGKAGRRLTNLGRLALELSPEGTIGTIAVDRLGQGARPVRVIAFDKSTRSNWALAWHQDRTICVRERHEVPGYGSWTVKQGLVHVAPPFELLSKMLTIRVHLDPVDDANAPLLIAIGSHRLGLINEDEVSAAVERSTLVSCLADAGDVWVYSTPILHASDRAAPGRRRRVLQIDYSADALPSPLEWRGLN